MRQWCRSRRDGVVCTRPVDHAGLHNRVGTGAMWSDAQADAPLCPGSGAPAAAAPTLPDGYPEGRGLCRSCWGFAEVHAGRLARHDAFLGAQTRRDAVQRAAWFNRFGWTAEEPPAP